jgi:SAM-dependent methyltransferase
MFTPHQRRTGPELLDLPPESYTREELEGTLRDIRLVNRYLGDTGAVLKYVGMFAEGGNRRGADALSILDVATGSGDMPAVILDWARERGINARVTGVDVNPLTVQAAGRLNGTHPGLTLAVADGFTLPFRDNSFDVVLCSKSLHHFKDDEAVRLVKEFARVARFGCIIMDIRRSWVAWALITILTRVFTRNRLTRADGPMSVLRSFTDGELESIARRAGLPGFGVYRERFFRLVLAGGPGWRKA